MQMFLILLVFIFGFGIAMQSVQYHNQALNYGLLTNIFVPAYFTLGGQYFELSGALNDSQNLYPGKRLKIKKYLKSYMNLNYSEQLFHARNRPVQVLSSRISIQKTTVQNIKVNK
jgi:hypothetical protein